MFRKKLIFIFEIFKIIVISLAIVLPIRYYLIQPFFVKGESMSPNFSDGDYLIVDEISYRLESPQRGDIIIFKFPFDPSQYYIKRVIGLPNESVEIKNGKVYINGIWLNESQYLNYNLQTPGAVKVVLGNDEYFVMGDNRQASYDSRAWGPLQKKFIIGKAAFRGWPITSAGIIRSPYFLKNS